MATSTELHKSELEVVKCLRLICAGSLVSQPPSPTSNPTCRSQGTSMAGNSMIFKASESWDSPIESSPYVTVQGSDGEGKHLKSGLSAKRLQQSS